MSCASSTTAKSKTAFLVFAIAAASEVNNSAWVIRRRDLQPGTNALEDRPQHLALRLRQPGLSAEPRDIAIRLPVLQLPCIDHLLPFGEKKMLAEFVAADGIRGLSHQFAYDLRGSAIVAGPTWAL